MKKLSSSDTLCTQLWNHAVVDLSQQRFRACCKTPSLKVSDAEVKDLGEELFLNHPVFINDREIMLSGGRPERCGVCWKQEEKGHKSFRRDADSWHRYFAPFEEQIIDPKLAQFPDNLDIQLDNYCDLKCLYCNEEFSSQWQNEKLRFGEKIPARSSAVNPELERNFFRWFDGVKSHFKRIAFLGGEPLISPIFYDYFEKILQSYQGSYPEGLEFNIITNLNTPEATFEKFVNLLQKHCHQVTFNINISMEAWGEKAELIRAGVDFKRFSRNFEKLAGMDQRIILSTITSLNVLSISSLHSYIKFVLELEDKYRRIIHLHPNLILYPEWLGIDLVHPKFFELYIVDTIAVLKDRPHQQNYYDFLKSLKGQFRFGEGVKNSPAHKQFIAELKVLAERRNVNYQEVFKEYDYLWNVSSGR